MAISDLFKKNLYKNYIYGTNTNCPKSDLNSDIFTFYKCTSVHHFVVLSTPSAGFTYRLDRLKPRASKFRGPPVKVYIFNTVIELSHLCCHNILYFLNNHSGIFLTQLHSISEYCRILNTPHRLRLY